MGGGKYSIGIKICEGPQLVYSLSISSRCPGIKKNLNHFNVSFSLQKDNSIKIINKKLTHANDDWTISNYLDIAKGLFIFFLNTKQYCSEKWTEAWYIKSSENKGLIYKMYDCSAKFLKINASHYNR